MSQLNTRLKKAARIKLVRCAYVALGYFAFLIAGEVTTGGATNAPLIAPAVAFLASILITSNKSNWPCYCIAAGLVEYLYAVNHYHVAQQVAVGFGVANLVEALVAATLVQRRVPHTLDLSFSSHATTFIIGVGIMAPFAGAVVGGLSLAVGLHTDFWLAWRRWWLSDAISQFILTPIIIMVLSRKVSIDRSGVVSFGTVTALSLIVLLSAELASHLDIASWITQESVFLLLPLMVWLASRAGTFWVTLATAVTTVAAIYLYSTDKSLDVSTSVNLQVHLQLLLFVLSATATIAGALFEEKRRILLELEVRRDFEQRASQASKLQALGLLTGGIAHDFNNLLGIVGLRVELTRKTLPLSELQEMHLKAAGEAIKKGSQLVKKLLTFSREKPHAAELINLKRAVADAVEMLQKSKDTGVKIQYWERAGDIFCVASDAELESAVVNLILNARDAIDGEGTINVGVNIRKIGTGGAIDSGGKEVSAGDYGCIIVRDSGRGMSSDEMSRCFDPFFTTKGVGAGTGLGLTMVYGFARRASGGVFVESTIGEGTTFTILIPVRDSPKESLEVSQPLVADKGEVTVLVVDDNVEFRDAVATLLSESGFTALKASSGSEALSILQSVTSISILLTDIVMPGGMSGVQLAAIVRSRHPSIRIMLMTGFSDGNLRTEIGGEHNAYDVIYKPFDIEALCIRLRSEPEKVPHH